MEICTFYTVHIFCSKHFHIKVVLDSVLCISNNNAILMNDFIQFEAQVAGTTQDHLQIFNIELKAKVKSHQMPEQVTVLSSSSIFKVDDVIFIHYVVILLVQLH